jgi:hypothetical protein
MTKRPKFPLDMWTLLVAPVIVLVVIQLGIEFILWIYSYFR